MKKSTGHLISLVGFLAAGSSANAHDGEHAQSTMVWLAHMLSSVDHVSALLCLAAVVGVVASIRSWLSIRKTRAVNVALQAVDQAAEIGER
jgi:hypothetical protein